MALTDQEIEDKAKTLIDNGVAKEDVISFIDAARSEQTAPSDQSAPDADPIEPGKPGGMTRREWRRLPMGTKLKAKAKPYIEGFKKLGEALKPEEGEFANVSMDPSMAAWYNPGGGVQNVLLMSKAIEVAEKYIHNPEKGPVRRDVILEAGIPLLVQAATAPFSPAVQSTVGGSTSAAMNGIAQLLRISEGRQNEFHWMRAAQAGALGSVVVAGPLRTANALTKPLLGTVSETLKTGVKIGAVASASELAAQIEETGITEDGKKGEIRPDAILAQGALPIIGSIAIVPPQVFVSGVATGLSKVAQRASLAKSVGFKPSVGQLLPERYAGIEEVSAKAGGIGRGELSAAQESFEEIARSPIGDVIEKPKLWDEVKPYLKQIDQQKSKVEAFSAETQEAMAARDKAVADLQKARDSLNAEQEQAALKAVEEGQSAALQNGLADIDASARDIFKEMNVGPLGREALTTPQLLELASDTVVKPANQLMKAHFDAEFSKLPKLEPVFDTSSIRAKAEEQLAMRGVTGDSEGLAKLQGAMNRIKAMLPEGQKASIQQMRNVQDELTRLVKFGELTTSSEDHAIKAAIHEISDTMGKQASAGVLGKGAAGEDLGELFSTVNSQWKKKMEFMDKPGVATLFEPSANNDSIYKIADGFLKGEGATSPEYRNLMEFADYLRPMSPASSGMLKSQIRDIVREAIITKSSQQMDSVSGNYFANFDDLVKNLEKVGAAPGALEELGFVDREMIQQAKDLTTRFKDATKMTAKQVDTLLANPLVAAAKKRQGTWFRDTEKALADSQARNQIAEADLWGQLGDVDKAESAVKKAENTLAEAGFREDGARVLLEEYQNDPTKIVLNAASNKGVDQFFATLLNTNSTEINNELVQKAMRAFPTVTQEHIKSRLLADTLAKINSEFPYFTNQRYGIDSEKFLQRFSNLSKQTVNDYRSRFVAVFGDEAEEYLKKVETAADMMQEASREVKAYFSKQDVGKDLGFVGTARAILRAVPNLMRRGEYWMATKLMMPTAEAYEKVTNAMPEALGAEVPTSERMSTLPQMALERANLEETKLQQESKKQPVKSKKKANPSEKAGPDRDILNIATSGESAPAEEAPLFRPPAQS